MSELVEVPWKNGGGVTREIAARRRGDALVWRLSMADVASDGPFSRFDGLSRILIVIAGNGMELTGPAISLQADYGVPVRFDGGLAIASRLKAGPLRDLNLMFDPVVCTGDATVIANFQSHHVEVEPDQIAAFHCFKGAIGLGGEHRLAQGDTALLDPGPQRMTSADGASAVLVTVTFAAHIAASNPDMAAR